MRIRAKIVQETHPPVSGVLFYVLFHQGAVKINTHKPTAKEHNLTSR